VAATSRDEIVAFCDELLDVAEFDDYCPNGLQVPGAELVERVVSGVSANLELLQAAADARAELVLVHHGVFWDAGSRALSAAQAERLRVLLGGQVSLCGYHLPLDAHPEVGNNALLCEGLGLDKGERFAEVKGSPIGFVGHVAGGPLSPTELAGRVRDLTGREPLVFDEGPAEIRSVGIVSGGGASSLEQAVELNLDAMVTGEPSEPARATARESGIHFIAAGHHATETFGVSRLGELIGDRFGVEYRFIEVPNPV
jgi:dinuclear metal center YbgI/SA1388 family protein